MPSERIQRQIDRLLDAAEAASARRDWRQVLDLVDHVLTCEPENADALAMAAVARRGPGSETGNDPAAPSPVAPPAPTAFANGRYPVKRFLGEGGKKRVYLARRWAASAPTPTSSPSTTPVRSRAMTAP